MEQSQDTVCQPGAKTVVYLIRILRIPYIFFLHKSFQHVMPNVTMGNIHRIIIFLYLYFDVEFNMGCTRLSFIGQFCLCMYRLQEIHAQSFIKKFILATQ